MGILAPNSALSLAIKSYRDAIPDIGQPVKLTTVEWSWINGLVSRAVIMSNKVSNLPRAWTLSYLFNDGIRWQINVEAPALIKAGKIERTGEIYSIPPIQELLNALENPESFGAWWEKYAHIVYIATMKQDPLISETLKLLWPPKYIRLRTGWRDIKELWLEIAEAGGRPGPKRIEFVNLCKDIVRAFPAPVKYPETDEIDLTYSAALVVIGRLK